MPDFNTYMSVGLNKCAPTGEGTGPNRRRVFDDLVELWNAERERIEPMSRSELEAALECP